MPRRRVARGSAISRLSSFARSLLVIKVGDLCSGLKQGRLLPSMHLRTHSQSYRRSEAHFDGKLSSLATLPASSAITASFAADVKWGLPHLE